MPTAIVGPCSDGTVAHPALEPIDLTGPMELTGRLVAASNASFLATVHTDQGDVTVIHKPIRGERELWDFPTHTLGLREVAAHQVSAAGGFDVVPFTCLTEGPYGMGSTQRWVGSTEAHRHVLADDSELVDVVPVDEVPEGWHVVLHAEDEDGHLLAVAHSDDPRLRRLAVFDALVNNADRKVGHLLPDGAQLFGCDHGISFHVEPKLRTVLWGWAGEPLDEAERSMVTAALDGLDDLADLLSEAEIAAIGDRATALLTDGLPEPREDAPAVPWPLW